MKEQQRHDYVLDMGLAAWDPGADAHVPNGPLRGACIFRTRESQREYYRKRSAMTGEAFQIDPDGGLPVGDELAQLRARERYEAVVRAAMAKRLSQRRSTLRGSAGGRRNNWRGTTAPQRRQTTTRRERIAL